MVWREKLEGEGKKDAGIQSLWAGPVPLGAASIWAGWALLTCLPKGSWLCALALSTDAVPAVAADLAIFALARADIC